MSFLDDLFKALGESAADPPPVAEPEEPPSIASLMMAQKDLLEPIIEASVGLREDLVSRGYTENTAEMLAAQYLSLMFMQAFNIPKL